MKDHLDSPHSSTSEAPKTAGPGAALGASTLASGRQASEPTPPIQIWASQRVVHLFLKLTIYYLSVSIIVFTAVTLYPQLHAYLPIGGAVSLIGDVTKDPFSVIEINASQVSSLTGSVIWMTIAITGAVLTILPVSWTYMSIRKRSDYDQSLVETIMILPIAVTSLVIHGA